MTILSAEEVKETASTIVEIQRPDGMIPWYPGGHCDPWNHVEAAMALSAAGFRDEALLAYQWLADAQLPGGGWFNYYLSDGSVLDFRLDTNVCAYVATGALHYYWCSEDRRFLEEIWPVVDKSMMFVLGRRRPDGAIWWSVDPDGRQGKYALLAGSSSIYRSLRCALTCAQILGHARPRWEIAAEDLANIICNGQGAFEPKDEFAMDWYYPVLSGAMQGEAARRRIDGSWEAFVMDGRGVRCVSTSPWVTVAETAECALALDALGRSKEAARILEWTRDLRNPDGTYWTGMVYPDEVSFPVAERTTYTSAAVVLAVDALVGISPAGGLFRGDSPQDPKRSLLGVLGELS